MSKERDNSRERDHSREKDKDRSRSVFGNIKLKI
jgi:hypothetical protein